MEPENQTPVGWTRRLWAGEEHRLAEHLHRLEPEALRCRFLGGAGKKTIDDHIERMKAKRLHWTVFGWFHNARMSAAVELVVEGERAEAALTTERPFRGHGIARRLLERAAPFAAQRGARRLVLITDPANTAMVRLARAAGAAFKPSRGEAVAELALVPPDAHARLLDGIEEQNGQAASAVADMQARAMSLWSLWLPSATRRAG